MIDRSKVVSVYTGKTGKCCCGCAGNHSKNKAVITRVVNILNKHGVEYSDEYLAYKDVGNRTYIAYLLP